YRRAGAEQGIHLSRIDGSAGPLPLQALLPDQKEDFSRAHYLLARIDYPEGVRGHLVYVKPSLTGDEPNDLLGYRSTHRAFPNDPTENQLFDADQFESYRQLGDHIGDQLCRDLLGGPSTPSSGELWEEDFDLESALEDWLASQGSSG